MMRVKCLFATGFAVAVLSGVLALSAADRAPSSHPATQGLFLDSFQKHWNTAKGLALAVADAMPAESYDFKPSPPEMSFGEQMIHIADANYFYCAFMTDAKSPYPEPAKDAKIEKAGAMKDLGASFDYCSKVFAGLDEAKLAQSHAAGKRTLSTLDAMLGVMVHMAHHRGQAEVYLRVKGIAPPKYDF
jgi:uncharacterized damage-inducible protein DinB